MAVAMRVLSLFSGIGGMDLGLERAGMTIAYHSEIDEYCVRVLEKHWPNVPNLGDVKKIKWEELEDVDVIAGGYPCQPFSTAGKRKGEEDPRHLWPYVFDAIRTIRPRFALLENVRGHLSLGFGTVLGDLASIGFDAEWQVLPASAFGAPHRRDRVFIVAYPEIKSSDGRRSICGAETIRGGKAVQEQIRGGCRDVADASGRVGRCTESHGISEIFGEASESREPSSASGAVGGGWEVEPDAGRVAYGVPARVDRLRALGNAVVPQVAEYVGRRILAHSQIAV